MRDYEKLDVWKKSHQLTLDVYKITELFPDSEKFGLIVHLRKTAASIPTNIAEGCGRRSQREFYQFLNIASGSASELDYQLRLSNDLGYLDVKLGELNHYGFQVREQVTEVKKMLSSLMQQVIDDNARHEELLWPRRSKP